MVIAGGVFGSSLRFFSTTIFRYFIPSLPIGTLFVNIVGCFFIGILMSYLEYKNFSQIFIKYFLIIGLLGSYTTFSAFSFEIFEMFNNRKIFLPFIYIFVTLSLCIIFTFIGYNLNRIIF